MSRVRRAVTHCRWPSWTTPALCGCLVSAAAAQLGELLAAFTQEPRRSMDVIAVFRRLSETAASVESAATELRRQEWFDLDSEADPEAAAAWSGALEGLRSAASTFEWFATGWI